MSLQLNDLRESIYILWKYTMTYARFIKQTVNEFSDYRLIILPSFKLKPNNGDGVDKLMDKRHLHIIYNNKTHTYRV